MKYFKPKLYIGHIYHKRFHPKVHDFRYRSFFIKVSLLDLSSAKNIFFSLNRFNLFSFYDRDHGHRDGSSLIDFARSKLIDSNLPTDFDDIVIHTYPRILGYVFNPVSFWYFYKNGVVYATMAEVNNTFGETISYILPSGSNESLKEMQVSPFNRIEGDYKFTFTSKDTFEKVAIQYFINEKLIIFASIEGHQQEFNAKNLFSLFLKNPIHNLGAVFFIHLEALFLFLKKVPFYGKNGVIHDRQQ